MTLFVAAPTPSSDPAAVESSSTATVRAASRPPKGHAGSLDTSFGRDGMVTIPLTPPGHQETGHPFDSLSVALQSNGEILIVGSVSLWESVLVRVTADGAIDSRFGVRGQVDHVFGDTKANALAVAVQADDRILVAGIADWNDGRHQPDFALARFNSDGSPDLRFGSNGVVRTDLSGSQDCARAMVLQPDGRIVLAGDAFGDFALARYMPDGSLDAGFGTAGTVRTDLRGNTDTIAAVTILPDGSILVGGTSWSKSSDFDFAVVRYRSDGRIDRGFGANGSSFVDLGGALEEARAMAVQPDGRIIIAGDTLDAPRKVTHLLLARLNPDGSLDGRFGQGGRLISDFKAAGHGGSALVLLPDGRLVVAGDAGSLHSSDFGLARYSSDGRLDPTFGEHGKVLADLQQFAFHNTRTLARQADGRLLLAVRTVTADHAQSFTLARYLP